ncbi:MAG TPA: family 3 encapsulin nanocompartment shell protein [Streptosporangiaceae bacterium]
MTTDQLEPPAAASAVTRRTPGEEFAWAVAGAQGGADVEVPFQVPLPAAFPLFATRPRYAVRHLLKTAAVPDHPVPYVHEPPAPPGSGTFTSGTSATSATTGTSGSTSGARPVSGTSYATSPEAAFRADVLSAELTDLRASVPVPKGLLDEPALLAAFVDHRVLVRLSTVENEALLHGTADGAIIGLLRLPDLRRVSYDGSFATDPAGALTAAAAEVEETGGSCDGIVAHPVLYWRLVRDGALSRLAQAGIRVSRTRMIARDQVLLGDFRAAVTLLDPGVSLLALRRGGGADAGPDGGDRIEATARAGLAVHLPQHFVLLSPAGREPGEGGAP